MTHATGVRWGCTPLTHEMHSAAFARPMQSAQEVQQSGLHLAFGTQHVNLSRCTGELGAN